MNDKPTVPTRGPLRVGVVGLGYAGTTHLEAFAAIEGVDVVALAGHEPARLAELGARHGIPTLMQEWEDLVALPDLDIVSIATPNALHAPIAIAALARGAHVFCEKPLALDSVEAAAMVRAATEADRVLEVAFNHRRRADIQWVRRYLETTGIGRIYHVRASWKRRSGIPGIHSWFTSLSAAGGGALIDLGPHVLDSVLHLLGEPTVTTVSAVAHGELGRAGYGAMDRVAQMASDSGEFEVEDLVSALMRTDTGTSIQFEISWAAHAVDDEDISIELLGVDGGVRIFVPRYLRRDTIRVFRDDAGIPISIVPDVTVPEGDHARVIDEFVDVVRSREWSAHRGRFALHRTEVLDACYRSAERGREVVIDR